MEEEGRQLFYDHKMVSNSLPFRKTPLDRDEISRRCKIDHITPPATFSLRKNVSCYAESYSPDKLNPTYVRPQYEKQLQDLRKKQDNSPRLPAITNNSQYQCLYKPSLQGKLVQNKQKQSSFLKLDWALKPLSNYQKSFQKKNSPNFNSLNRLRVNHNNILIHDLQCSPKGISLYRRDFKAHQLKPQMMFAIGNKDHLKGKENYKVKKGWFDEQNSSQLSQNNRKSFGLVKTRQILRMSLNRQ